MCCKYNVNKKRLEVLQNKGLRCALNKGIETSTDELHKEANLLKLNYRREQHLLNIMYDQAQVPSLLKFKDKNVARTRSSKKKLMKIRKPRTERFKKVWLMLVRKRGTTCLSPFIKCIRKTLSSCRLRK